MRNRVSAESKFRKNRYIKRGLKGIEEDDEMISILPWKMGASDALARAGTYALTEAYHMKTTFPT